MIVQNDSFVTNIEKFDPRFLEYDYIGAPWIHDAHYNYIQVGNGGFSLRSKRFLEISQKYCPTDGFNEDHSVCITYRDLFLINGIQYAPLEVAAAFSYENDVGVLLENSSSITPYDTFGIHGKNEYYKQVVNSDEWKNILNSSIITFYPAVKWE